MGREALTRPKPFKISQNSLFQALLPSVPGTPFLAFLGRPISGTTTIEKCRFITRTTKRIPIFFVVFAKALGCRLHDLDSLIDSQGAQEEPERRPGGPGKSQKPMLPIGSIGLVGSLWSL